MCRKPRSDSGSVTPRPRTTLARFLAFTLACLPFGAAVAAPPPGPMPRPLWVQPGAPAAEMATALRTNGSSEADLLDRLADTPTGVWLGGWTSDPQSTVADIMASSTMLAAVPVFVAYNIPNRDCNQYSAGGKADGASYLAWIQSVAAGLGNGDAIVILEPDSLIQMDCLSDSARQERLNLLRSAVATLAAHPGTRVYLDGGHPEALDAHEMAARLREAGVDAARGFALNVSNFVSTGENIQYGDSVVQALGSDARYVVDTSRNGRDANGEWCNPFGRGLGEDPTLNTGLASGDAFLWVKRPGESDGSCHGGPAAGAFWNDYALELAKSAWEPKFSVLMR